MTEQDDGANTGSDAGPAPTGPQQPGQWDAPTYSTHQPDDVAPPVDPAGPTSAESSPAGAPDDPQPTRTFPAFGQESAPPPPPAGPAVAEPQQPYGRSPYTAPEYGQTPYAPPRTEPAQPEYGQSPYARPSYDQPAYDQPGYGGQPDYPQQPYGRPAYDRPSYDQPAYDQPGYGGQPGYSSSAYPQPPYAQAGYGQPAPAQPGYPQPGYGERQYGGSAYGGSAYGQPGYAPPGYGPPGAAPQKPPRKKHGVLWSLTALVVVVIVLVVLSLTLKIPSGLYPKKLSHTAVESFIAKQYDTSDVSCNGGDDISIKKGKTFTCTAADNARFKVTLTDDDGGYDPEPDNG